MHFEASASGSLRVGAGEGGGSTGGGGQESPVPGGVKLGFIGHACDQE